MSLEIKKLKLKNSFANHVLINGLIEAIVTYVKTNVPKYLELRLNQEFTKSVCNIVEKIIINDKTLTKKQKSKILKEQIIIEAFKLLFELNDDEISQLESQISFLLENNMIKPKSTMQKIAKTSAKFLKKLL